MYECDECNATLEEGDEAFYFSDGSDEYIFCCEVCAANFLCDAITVGDDEDFDEEDGIDYEIDLGLF